VNEALSALGVTTIDVPATITAIAAVITAVGFIVTAILTFMNRRATMAARDRATVAADAAVAAQTAIESSKRDLVETANGIFEVGKKLDGRLTQLLEAATALARAEGKAEGEQAQRDRAAGPQP
jgi:hypothetical protein